MEKCTLSSSFSGVAGESRKQSIPKSADLHIIQQDKNMDTMPQQLSRHSDWQKQFAKLSQDESGETAIEFLMILTFGVLPMILAVWLLQDVIQEYVAFGQIFISSPFF